MGLRTFAPQNTRVRGDTLGAPVLIQSAQNIEVLVNAFLREHGHPGAASKHNSLEIPRLLGRLSNTGAAYDPYNLNGVYLSNNRPATGTVEVEIDPNYLAGEQGTDLAMLVNVNGDGPATKPHVACVDWDTSGDRALPQVHIKRLSSALGAGNTWGAIHNDIDIALYSHPFEISDPGYLAPDDFSFGQGEGLRAKDDQFTNIRGLLRNQGLWRAHLDEGHTVAGAHSVIEIAAETGTITQSAGTYSLGADAEFASVSTLGTGQIEVTLSATYSATTNIHPWVTPDYSSGTGSIVACARSYSTSKIRVYIYEFDGTNWARADSDFFLVVHAN